MEKERTYQITQEHKIIIFISALTFWFSLWGFVSFFSLKRFKMTQLQQNDFRNRIVSMTHGVFSLIMSAYQFFFLQKNYGGVNSDFQNCLLTISLAYFIYDVFGMAYYRKNGTGMYFHHAILISGFGNAVINNVSASQLVACFLISEISNPPMHMRTILKQMKLRYTQLWETCQMSFLFLYIAARIGVGPKILYDLFYYSPSIMLKILGSLLLLQSFFYAFRMVRIIGIRAQQWLERKQKGVTLHWLSQNPQILKLSFYKQNDEKIF